MYTIYISDGTLTKKVKEEANIILASSDIDNIEKDRLNRLIILVNRIDNLNGGIDFDNSSLLQDLINFDKTRLLSSLTLSDDEFEYNDEDEIYKNYINKRYPYITKHKYYLGTIESNYINHKAFIISPKNTYNHNEKKQINTVEYFISPIGAIVYITKGGIVTGEYIKTCYIDDLKSLDYLTKPIELVVDIIYHDNCPFYIIDSKNPKLKELRYLYHVPILHNKNIEHYNIRKYEKITK